MTQVSILARHLGTQFRPHLPASVREGLRSASAHNAHSLLYSKYSHNGVRSSLPGTDGPRQSQVQMWGT